MRGAQQGGFERSGARTDNGRIGGFQQRVGAAGHHADARFGGQVGAEVGRGASRRGGDHQFVAVPVAVGAHQLFQGGVARRQPGNLVAAAARQQGDRPLARRLPELLGFCLFFNAFTQRIPQVACLRAKAAEVLGFEGEEHVEPVHVPLDLADPLFVAGPEFGGDIVIDPDAAAVGVMRHPQVKAGIIDGDEDVGSETAQFPLHLARRAGNRAQAGDDLHGTHHRNHLGGAPETDFCLRVGRPQRFGQFTAVLVAGGFAG